VAVGTVDGPDATFPGGGRLPLLTAIADPVLEAQVIASLATPRARIAVVRRCVDLPDLLAAAATGTAVAALVSADLRRLDQDARARLQRLGLAVVGINDDAAPDAERAEVRLRQLGVDTVVPVSSRTAVPADELAGRLADAVEQAAATRGSGSVEPEGGAAPVPARATGPDTDTDTDTNPDGDADPALSRTVEDSRGGRDSRVIAVWGPTGAPGRSFLTWNLGGALAAAGRRVLLVDADTYGGALVHYAGMVDEAPGIVAACRAANAGALDAERLAALARTVAAGDATGGSGALTVLSGIGRGSRWPEVRPVALDRVLELARLLADVILVDCGFALEEDEELSYDTLAPQRNGACLAALRAADEVLAVGTADPIGLTRLIAGLGELDDVFEVADNPATVSVVVNRVRPGGRERRQVADALDRHAGRRAVALLPLDVPAADRVLAQGRSVSELAPRSPLAGELGTLVEHVLGSGTGTGREELPRRRRRFALGRS
jgi:MinD-like ATPase involved in chromosome partitioning or flagellar assembly